MQTIPLALAAWVAALPCVARAAAAPSANPPPAPSAATPSGKPSSGTSPSHGATPPSARAKASSGPELGYDVRVRAWGGAFDGLRTLEASGPLLAVDAALTPKLESGHLKVDLPLRAGHTERPGNDLSETDLSASFEPEYRASRTVSLGAEGGVLWVDRPGWPDQYQRDDVTGELAPTDRYGYTSWRAGGSAWLRLGGGQHLRARYRYSHYSYEDEPAFDPADPSHLTPRDNGRHDLDVSWRLRREAWTVTARLESFYRLDEVALARDAGTGDTNPGGVNNPLQRLRGTEPSAEIEWTELAGRVDLSLYYGIAFQTDTYDGYYTYQEQHPRARARVQLSPRLEGDVGLEGRFLLYGSDSTSASRLEWGDRRQDTRLLATGGVSYGIGGGFALRGEASVLWRETNYPDYTPPGSDIDWDYTNLYAAVGIEWRASRDPGKRTR